MAVSPSTSSQVFAVAWREMPVGQERYGDVYIYTTDTSETRRIFVSPNGTTNPHYALAGSEWRVLDERTWLFGAWADVANGVEAPWFCYNLRFQSAVPLVSR